MPRTQQQDVYTIGEVVKQTGKDRTTIIRWGLEGKLNPLRNPFNGYREYSAKELTKAKKLAKLGGITRGTTLLQLKAGASTKATKKTTASTTKAKSKSKSKTKLKSK